MGVVRQTLLCLFVFLFLFVEPVAAAFDGGDIAALIIGLFIGVIGIFACLGCYARKKAGHI